MSTEPRCAADPRPDGQPYYIDPDCPTCDAPLVLVDEYAPGRHEGPIWHDEWVCPVCEAGVHLDVPDDLAVAFGGG